MAICSSAAVRQSGAIASAKALADTPMARPISGGITAAPTADAAAWNPIKWSATAADVRSAVVRTSSGYIEAVDNPNSSIAVVAVLGVAAIASPAATTMPPTAGPITRHARSARRVSQARAVRRP